VQLKKDVYNFSRYLFYQFEKEVYMKSRKRRTEILAASQVKDLKKMAKLVEERHVVEVLEKPNSGLIMVKMRESAQKHLFYLGEVFVTECKVTINDVIGLGVIRGAHLKKAYFMAVIDAAYNAELAVSSKLEKMLNGLEKEVNLQKTKDVARILKTKVDFETLDEEVKA
jgi:alpha-D-ribose 1-methylphosphonate 5-triphosphate synthase subunit PhnG